MTGPQPRAARSRDPIVAPIVVVPTYNELENLERIVQRALAATPQLRMLVVDDGSPDGTGKLADELAAAEPRLAVLHREAKAGLGAAYLAGFAWALEHSADAVLEMDADGSHAPEAIPTLLAALSDHDVALGSRWMPGGSVVDWPKHREWLSRGGNFYTRAMLGLPLTDATGGFRAYRRAVLEGLNLASVVSSGYCFQVDLARRAWRAGYAFQEVPIRFVERTAGHSKMSSSIVREALWRVTVWGITDRRSRSL